MKFSRFFSALAVCMFFAAGLSSANAADDAPAPGTPTFSKDIAPILQANCQTCHRPGETAPMSLLSYNEARPWVKSIVQAVESRQMPPWHADPAHGKWANERKLTDAQIDTIVKWAKAGAPEGNPADLPAPLKFTTGWTIGEPDKVIYISEKDYVVKADVEDQYQFFTVDPGFTEDVWVEAVEPRAGNPAIVHHIIVAAIDPKKGMRGGLDDGPGWLSAMAPGRPADVFGDGKAKLITAGSRIIFQMHYHKEKGVEAADRSMVGLRFAKDPVDKVVNNVGLSFQQIRLAPGQSDVFYTVERTFQQDVHFLTVMPHMHLRGRSMRVTAFYPEGKSETLLNVPQYDFNWQTTYIFQEPKAIPAGTRVRVESTYDNSANNPHNPDPAVEVRRGQKTTDEMMIAFIDYTVDEEKILAGKRVEPLPPLRPDGTVADDDDDDDDEDDD
jgi:mono/diheme cytochrome c family protein